MTSPSVTNWSVLHLRTHRSFESSNVLKANHKSTEIEGKMCPVRIMSSYIHQLFRSTRSLSLSLWLNPSPISNWLKFADGINIVIICTYLQSVCVKSQETWAFRSPLISFGMLAFVSGNYKSTETESKCKQLATTWMICSHEMGGRQNQEHGTWNMEHPGTLRNIAEHRIIIIQKKICKIEFWDMK